MNFTNKLLGLSLAAVVGFAATSFADDSAMGTSKKSLESRIAELESKLKDAGVGGGVKGSGIKISGYVDTSYIANFSNRSNSGPVAGSSFRNTGRVYDNQFNAFNLNGVKLTIQKDKDTSKFPAGFRVDTIYGEDANVLKNTKSQAAGTLNGFNDSDFLLQQAYINLGVPVGNGIDINIGKMTTLIGYEAIESPANWQFSRSDAYRLQPNLQTGVTFGYKWNDTLTSTVGVINGWDSTDRAGGRTGGAINFNTALGFVGRVDVSGPRTVWGDFDGFLAGFYSNDDTSGTASALNRPVTFLINPGGTWFKPLGVKPLKLGVEYMYRDSQVSANAVAAGIQNPILGVNAHTTSAYGAWDWNKWLTTSGRFSYTAYGNVGTQPPGTAASGTAGTTLSPLVLYTGAGREKREDLYSFTLTQAFNVWKDTLVRLEWRRDWTTNTTAGFGNTGLLRDDIRQTQDTIAVNVVYSF